MKVEIVSVFFKVVLVALVLLFLVAFVFGYVMNLFSLFSMSELTPIAALRVVGAFIAPLGAVLGYL